MVSTVQEYGTFCLQGTLSPVDCSLTAFAHKMAQMMEKFPKARFYQYDTEEADDLVNELGNHPMPCFTIFREGDKVDTVMGPHNNALENAIQGCYSGEVRE